MGNLFTLPANKNNAMHNKKQAKVLSRRLSKRTFRCNFFMGVVMPLGACKNNSLVYSITQICFRFLLFIAAILQFCCALARKVHRPRLVVASALRKIAKNKFMPNTVEAVWKCCTKLQISLQRKTKLNENIKEEINLKTTQQL